jgi:hypothetical protein
MVDLHGASHLAVAASTNGGLIPTMLRNGAESGLLYVLAEVKAIPFGGELHAIYVRADQLKGQTASQIEYALREVKEKGLSSIRPISVDGPPTRVTCVTKTVIVEERQNIPPFVTYEGERFYLGHAHHDGFRPTVAAFYVRKEE